MAPKQRNNLPSPVKNAALTAKLIPGMAIAVAGAVFAQPEIAAAAGALGVALPIVIDQLIERGQKILLKQIEKGNFHDLSEEQTAAFFPLAWRYFESVRRGDYEHILEILAAYLVGELKQEIPEPGNFVQVASRLEGLSTTDLKVMTLIDLSPSTISKSSTEGDETGERPSLTAISLKVSPQNNKWGLTKSVIQESLVDLMGRAFLIPDEATRVGKTLGYYYASQKFIELMARVRGCIEETSTSSNN